MQNKLLTLHAQTSIHAGSGKDDSVIDLPIQRESHTGYPCVFGSSMKGALRAHAEARISRLKKALEETDDDNKKAELDASLTAAKNAINPLFGFAGTGNDGSAGAALVSDARILLLPIRSLTGQFRWVTCPNTLARFKQDAVRFGTAIDTDTPSVQSGQVLTPNNEEVLYLEEYRFNRPPNNDNNNGEKTPTEMWADELANYLCYDEDEAKSMLKEQLAIISNEDFAYLAQYALPVNPHIAVDSQTKTTVGGALWYEETLPSDSVLYLGIAIDDERKKGGETSSTLADDFQQLFDNNRWLQIGGNETVGMGWCHVEIQAAGE